MINGGRYRGLLKVTRIASVEQRVRRFRNVAGLTEPNSGRRRRLDP